MGKLTRRGMIVHYYVFLWMAACTNCTSKAYERLSRNPLAGSAQRVPGDRWPQRGGRTYSYSGNEDLTRLLDVGACSQNPDYRISYVPPLDGASPINTLCQDNYAMKFVLFDLQLVELKDVDPVAGSFRVELQMIFHWIDSVKSGAKGTIYTDDCSFICDTNSPTPLCCDEVWVPPLRLSGCEVHEIKSHTPTPYITYSFDSFSYSDCLKKENDAKCYWRRLWYLSIDATCSSDMNFRDFPFDVQSLTVEILNPYASRTWFQLSKGFLQDNIDEDINNIDLSPDRNILGWSVRDLKVSSTCGTSESWRQTFLTQDRLLRELSSNFEGYDTQREEIVQALSDLICPNMEDLKNSRADNDFTSPHFDDIYTTVKTNYEERLNFTLVKYKQCIEDRGKTFTWNMSLYKEDESFFIPNFGQFSTSSGNINRSFNIVDLEKAQNMTRVWFPCVISAISNLTTPGIKVSILVQRYRKFYVMKLILPTVACVAFSFSAFGLDPKDLVGRLTVVVPSAIALTALQSLVVATDIPPVAYIAPSTYIFIFSYLAQILISFESVVVKCLDSQQRHKWLRSGRTTRKRGPASAPEMKSASIGPYFKHIEGVEMCTLEIDEALIGPHTKAPNDQIGAPTTQEASIDPNAKDLNWHMSGTRKIDLFLMATLGALYLMTILICTLLPWHYSELFQQKENSSSYVSLWKV